MNKFNAYAQDRSHGIAGFSPIQSSDDYKRGFHESSIKKLCEGGIA